MLSWGEDCQRCFWVKGGSDADDASSDAGVRRLELGYQVSDVSAGRSVLAFVKSNGNAFIIRTNENRDGRRVRGKQKFLKCKEKIEAVSCGDDLVALLSEGGRLFCVDTTHPPFTPRPLEAFSNVTISQVACGSQHSVALTKDGQVFTWGQDSRGQLGLGRKRSSASSPQQLRALSAIPVVHVAARGEQSFALSVSGGVFGWGGNQYGQLGLGDTTDRHVPTSVQCLNMKKTSQISCGTEHTVVLTKHGAVFTFGSGRHGQLGHNSSRNELRPRLVAELWGAKVTKVACGRRHTLVLTETKKIYSFGCGDEGQLGHGEESHPSVPLPVQLPRDTSDGQVRNIFAGENCSFATCSTDQDSKTDSVISVTQPCLDGMIDKWTSECESKAWKKIKQEIHWMFSSASCLNKSFLKKSKEKHFQTSPKYHGLNLLLARAAFKELVKKEKLWVEVEAAILQLLPSLDKKPVGVEGLRIYLLLNELLHVIQKHTRQQSTKLAEAVAAAVTGLSGESLQVIGHWWSSLSPTTMAKYVKVWKQALNVILSYNPVPRNSGVKNLLLVLQYMYNVNSRVEESRRIPESFFCLMFDNNFLRDDLILWLSRSQKRYVRSEPLVLCNFPIVLDLQTKKKVFDMNTEYSKVTELTEHVMEEWFLEFPWFFPSPPDVCFVLDLERASVLEDTFQQLTAHKQRDYKRPLVVVFDQSYDIDDDNVFRRDFFYKVFHEMVSPESGMFIFNDSATLAWFPSRATQEDERYLKFGLLCGLALYNQCIIHLPFPLVLFKKLLGVKPSLEDMMEFSPRVAKSLQTILNDYSDDVIEDLYEDFHINWDGADVDLDPENPKKMLTGQNKKEFVDAYVNHVFNASVDAVFQDFKRGFFQVCDRDFVKLFRPKELQEVMVGKDISDWDKLKQDTDYEGEYNADHPTIQMFWEVFDELSEDKKRALLWFVTGFERLPVTGKDEIKMKVRVGQVNDFDYDQSYPEAHTCFSYLDLPLYSTKEIMKTKLIEALSNNLGIYR